MVIIPSGLEFFRNPNTKNSKNYTKIIVLNIIFDTFQIEVPFKIIICIVLSIIFHSTRRKIVRETLLNFEQSWDTWTSWILFNIIIIICDVPNFKKCITIRCKSQIFAIKY